MNVKTKKSSKSTSKLQKQKAYVERFINLKWVNDLRISFNKFIKKLTDIVPNIPHQLNILSIVNLDFLNLKAIINKKSVNYNKKVSLIKNFIKEINNSIKLITFERAKNSANGWLLIFVNLNKEIYVTNEQKSAIENEEYILKALIRLSDF